MRASMVRSATVLAVTVVFTVWPALAEAASWPLGSDAVALGFGASYPAPDGAARTHHGCDLLGSGGETVRSPLAGTVRFAGSVPGPHGGTVLAVTLEDEAGALLTMLPLSRLDAASGGCVGEGDTIGLLAETGDPSTGPPHLHVSLRVGGLYVDPLSLLERPSAAATPGSHVAEQGTAAPSGPPAMASAAPETPAGQGDPAFQLPAEAPSTVTQGSQAEPAAAAETALEAEPLGSRSAERSPLSGGLVAGSGRAGFATPPVSRLERGEPAVSRAGSVFGRRPATLGEELARRSPILRAAGVRVERIARAWLALALILCGAVALWPLWRGGAAVFSHDRNACGSPVGSEVVAAPGR